MKLKLLLVSLLAFGNISVSFAQNTMNQPCIFQLGDRVQNTRGEIGTVLNLWGDRANVLFDDSNPRGTISPGVRACDLILYNDGFNHNYRGGERVRNQFDETGTVVSIQSYNKANVLFDDAHPQGTISIGVYMSTLRPEYGTPAPVQASCEFRNGDRVANTRGEAGVVVLVFGTRANVVFDDAYPRGAVSEGIDCRYLSRVIDTPNSIFHIGNRVVNFRNEVGTVTSVYGNQVDVLFDDAYPAGTVSRGIYVSILRGI